MTKVEKNNAKFDKMTPAEKRVAMAKDALKWIKLGALIATKSLYIQTMDTIDGWEFDVLDA
jgi:hypothetical protein